MTRSHRASVQILRFCALLFVCAVVLIGKALAQEQLLDLSLELVDPKILRVCADPRNMPFSDEQGEGFENKLAELLAKKLGKGLAYTWYPQATGFVRNTLGAHKCDVVMGFPQGNDIVQSTNPYYRTSYALIFKPGNGLDGIVRESALHERGDPEVRPADEVMDGPVDGRVEGRAQGQRCRQHADARSDEYGVSMLHFDRLFTDDELAPHLDRLEADQQDDGGWPIRFEPPSAASGLEWRGISTVSAVETLRTYGRL